MESNENRQSRATRICWNRIWLNVCIDTEYEVNDNTKIFLLDEADNKTGSFTVKKSNDNTVLHINITNKGDNSCIDAGTYRIGIDNNTSVGTLKVADALIEELSDANKRFIYGDGNSHCNFSFFSDDNNNLLVKVEYKRKLTIKGIIKDAARKVLCMYLKKTYERFLQQYKNIKHKPIILFLYETEYQSSTNLVSLERELWRRGLEENYIIEKAGWCPSPGQRPDISQMRETVESLAKADYIFVDDNVTILNWIQIDKSVVLTQLWHAGVGFKAAGYSRWGHASSPEPFSCHRQYTYGICGSKKSTDVFSEVWGINSSQVLPLGLPRIDEFLNEKQRSRTEKNLYEKYPNLHEKKVILFAPTYRGKNWRDAYYPFDKIDLSKLYETCGSEYIVIFKMHPWIKKRIIIPDEYKDRMLDLSNYPRFNDLLYITDLLITDYSSNIFEFSLLDRPMLFYAFDEEDYKASRGFHLNYEESAPGRVVRTMDELTEAIKHKDYMKEKVKQYRDRNFDHIDTNASTRIIDRIILGKKDEVM